MTSFDVSVGGESRGGLSRPSGQHGMSSDRPSAGRLAVPPRSSTQKESSDKSEPVQPEVTTTDELNERERGGDRRIARREPRGTRVTVRFSEGEAAQLARVANRYRLSESGANRAAVEHLDGAPAPKLVNRDVLRLTGEVNAVGVNVNQLARQGWAGAAPSVARLDEATAALLRVVKELSA